MNPLRILLVDDHQAVRRGIRSLLTTRADWTVCGEAADGVEAIDRARELRPDLILMDISMPRMTGIEATRIIQTEMPEIKVIIVSQNDPSVVRKQAGEISANGYVAKTDLARDLMPAIDKATGSEDRIKAEIVTDVPGAEKTSGAPRADTSADDAARRRGEEASTLLAAIVDSSDDAIISKRLDGTITSWNPSAERLFGWTPSEAIGRHISLIIPGDRLQEETEIINRLKRGERVDHFETVRVRKDGSLMDISATISPLKDSSGNVVGASKVARDITERRRADAAIRASEERLRELSASLDAEVRARTKELEERNAELVARTEQLVELSRRMIRVQDEERRRIARELHDSAGQTLTVLGMNISALAKKVRPELQNDAKDLQDMLQQLSQEIRTTSYLLHPPLLDEIGLAAALGWYVQGLGERSDLKIDLQIPEDFERLAPDLELVIFRVVQECLTNIHRHSGVKEAQIRVERKGENVTLEVEDRGKGIAADKLARIQSQGSGVGIRGMGERVRQFGGEIRIESSESGTKVLVTLPFAPASSSSTADSSESLRTRG
jgi:PAS domain S-box-containing protein